MSKRMPSDSFLYAQLLDHRLDVVTHDCAQPDGLFAALCCAVSVGRPQKIGRPLVGVWSYQAIRSRATYSLIGISFLDTSVLTGPTCWSTNDRLTFRCSRSHFRPANSPLRNPAGMSRKTIALSRTPTHARTSCISSTSSTSDVRSRFAETRTPEPLQGPVMGFRSVNSRRIAWLKTALIASRIFCFVPPARSEPPRSMMRAVRSVRRPSVIGRLTRIYQIKRKTAPLPTLRQRRRTMATSCTSSASAVLASKD